eukprot:3152754-Prymnesium_polylepis.1
MALPQGIRGRGSRPRGCSGNDGSEHLHRVNRIHLFGTPGAHLVVRARLSPGFEASRLVEAASRP